MPKIDIASAQAEIGNNGYPHPFGNEVAGRERRPLGEAAGLDQFGVNLTRLKPGSWSAQRHWHTADDELVYILEGEVVLCEDDGETVLVAGDSAGFKANVPNRHCLINAVYLEIGTRSTQEYCAYPDIDLVFHQEGDKWWFAHKSGAAY